MPRHKVPAKGQSQKRSSVVSHTSQGRSWSFWLLAGLFLFWLIILMVFGYSVYRRSILSFSQPLLAAPLMVERRAEPTRISIPSLGINLPISEAGIEQGIWQTSPRNVSHLAVSARPFESGNMVLYGHNTRAVLARLPQMEVGEEIEVYSADGPSQRYVVKQLSVVKPDEIDAVQPTDFEKLTLYTCVGWLDSERLIVEAWPVE